MNQVIDENDPDFFSANIPLWNEVLSEFKGKPNVRFLEIGSLFGRSTEWLLSHVLTHPTSRITCIDIFRECYESLNYRHILGMDDYGMIPPDASFIDSFDDRISGIGATDRVEKIIADSEQGLRGLPFASYDCIYVDGSHSSRGVLTDLILAWGLLKKDGILIIDDYKLAIFNDNPRKNPTIGIDAFLDVFQDEYRLIEKGAQVILRKSAEKDDLWKR